MDWIGIGDFLMAHFAQLDENNIVTNVIVIANEVLIDDEQKESEQIGIDFCVSLFGGTWKQTSINNRIRKNYAGIGYKYDEALDAFIAPRPDQAIGFDEEICRWIMPEVDNVINEL
jgi:hypothetical protein